MWDKYSTEISPQCGDKCPTESYVQDVNPLYTPRGHIIIGIYFHNYDNTIAMLSTKKYNYTDF
jgi:hypothetical protein